MDFDYVRPLRCLVWLVVAAIVAWNNCMIVARGASAGTKLL
jgi:hypothetical protein